MTALPELIRLSDIRDEWPPVVPRPANGTVVVAVLPASVDTHQVVDALERLARQPALVAVPESTSRRLTAGDVTMDLGAHTVRVGDGPALTLAHREFRLLQAFLEHAGQVLSRAQLLDQAWDGPGYGTGRTVDVHVRRLRVKLAGSTTRVTTLRGFGYRFDV
ncbi:MAG: winged helix-turn-helix domain-containing protein [Jatrophihabitans sp.]